MRFRHLLAVPVAGLLVVAAASPLAVAQSVDAPVHRQSVLTEVDATGTTGASRIFTQLFVPAGETVSLNGQSTSGLRSLSGGLSVDGGVLRFGSGMSRTVANHTAEFPVSIDMRYAIDGEVVSPKDVVGHDGEVAITYIIKNLTAKPTELTLVNGDGATSTETVDIAVPFVGSLSMTLPSGFRDVVAPGAVVVGDGRGGTVVSWSLLLFAPLGSETQEVTWTAQATDAFVPAASLQVVPVTPDSFGSLVSTQNAYSGAVDSTMELTDGAREIDANLRQLADGAGELLAGLVALREGAQELAAGLVSASAGAGDLSDGLLQLSAGSSQLEAGVGELADGASQVDANAKLLAAGAGELSLGASQVLGGIQLLSQSLQGADGLPAALDGIAQLKAGIGAVGTANTILDGLDQVSSGLVQAQAGIGAPGTADTLRNGLAQIGGGLSNPLCNPADPANPANPCGISQLNASITGLSGQALIDLTTALTAMGSITSLAGAELAALNTAVTSVNAALVGVGTIQATSAGIATVVPKLQGGLAQVDAGLVNLSDAIGDPATADTLRNGVFRITAGVSNPACDPLNPTNPANPCGLLEGLTALESGLTDAAAEVAAGLGDTSTEGTLLWGADQVASGSSDLSTGAAQLQSQGTSAVAEGAQDALDGAEQVTGGAAAAADGGSELSDGLGQLSAGGEKLADGTVAASDGGDQIADGSQQLADEGTSVLADSVSDATVSSSLQLEQVRAVADRGIAGDGLPYPTVEGAEASAVYQFDLAGVGAAGATGLGGRLGIGGIALLAALALGLLARSRGRFALDLESGGSGRAGALTDRTTV